jgi:hypothetical protein
MADDEAISYTARLPRLPSAGSQWRWKGIATRPPGARNDLEGNGGLAMTEKMDATSQ